MRTPRPVAAAWRARFRGPTVVGAVACILVPLASWLVDGRGRLAYTMYSSTVTYRLEIAWLDEGGSRHAIDPTDLADDVSSAAAPFLTGASDFRTVAQIDALRPHLLDLARSACASRPRATIEITLHERSEPVTSPSFAAEPEAVLAERLTCPPSKS